MMLIMVMVMVMMFVIGCKPDPIGGGDDNDNNGSVPNTEGIYLGVIGFNENLTNKEIKLLNESSLSEFKNFVNNLQMEKGTGLYYADYTAINKLKSFGQPPKLNNVALVTFTDGLDNVSLASGETNPDGYTTTEAYSKALNDRIKNEKVHGKNITAYTIGIKGTDVYDDAEFHNNMNMLASSPDNVFEVSDMNEALQRFAQIAESLHSETTTSSLRLEIPGGYNDGVKIRFTFDNVSSAENSNKYIECTYRWTSNGRSLENITYHGLKAGVGSVSSVEQSGSYYVFEFQNLSNPDGSLISQSDINKLKLWRQISSGAWQPDAEFTPDSSSQVTEEQSSAVIMLVLDCTSSLGNQFGNMKLGANNFIETLVASAAGKQKPTVKTNSASNDGRVIGNVTNDGGAAVTERGVCWSTTQNPTISGSHKASGSGTGTFEVRIDGLTEGQTYYVRTYATNIIGTSYGEQKSFKYSNEINGYKYVDLGLPSGLKWADRNVGASSPEQKGGYYAWGETNTKSSYTESNCSTFGVPLNDISGKVQYDVASKKWGATWRLPKYKEMKELVDECTWHWINANGKKGYKVTGPNGKNIFLPAAGLYVGTENQETSVLHYWTGTPDGGAHDHQCAYSLNKPDDENLELPANYYRKCGFQIRPVSD